MGTRQEILAGIGLGLAVGVFVGMSSTPVVSIVLTAIAAVLAAFFGLSAGAGEGTRILRIASFSFACPLAVFLGVGIRSHSWLAPSVPDQVKEWTSAGYSQEQARSFVVFRQLGLVPEGQKTAEIPKSSNGLFASTNQLEDATVAECGRLSASRFSGVTQRIDAMRSTGGAWKTLADSVAHLDPDRSATVIEAAYRLVCH